jgi:hypothetical protein
MIKRFYDLQEITLHFKYLSNKEGGDGELYYCQIKIPRKTILSIANTKGNIPRTANDLVNMISYYV